MKKSNMEIFNKIEKEVFEDVLHDAKMELSFTDNRNVDMLSLPYRIRMIGILEGMKAVTKISEQFISACMSIIDKEDSNIRKEIDEFARSVA